MRGVRRLLFLSLCVILLLLTTCEAQKYGKRSAGQRKNQHRRNSFNGFESEWNEYHRQGGHNQRQQQNPRGKGKRGTLYDTLGLKKTASEGEIKRAYRNLAIKWHPDKNDDPEAQEKFIEISQAYETLSNKDERSIYDDELRYGRSKSNGQQGQHFYDARTGRRYHYSNQGSFQQRYTSRVHTVELNLNDLVAFLSQILPMLLLFMVFVGMGGVDERHVAQDEGTHFYDNEGDDEQRQTSSRGHTSRPLPTVVPFSKALLEKTGRYVVILVRRNGGIHDEASDQMHMSFLQALSDGFKTDPITFCHMQFQRDGQSTLQEDWFDFLKSFSCENKMRFLHQKPFFIIFGIRKQSIKGGIFPFDSTLAYNKEDKGFEVHNPEDIRCDIEDTLLKLIDGDLHLSKIETDVPPGP